MKKNRNPCKKHGGFLFISSCILKKFACGGEISYFRLFSSCSPYFRVSTRTKYFLHDFSPYYRVSSRTKYLYFRVSSRTIFCAILSLFPSFFSSVTSRTKFGKIACGGIEDNNIIVPVLQMSCSAWTLVSVRLRIVEVHSQVNQIRKLGNKSGSALSQACAHIYM